MFQTPLTGRGTRDAEVSHRSIVPWSHQPTDKILPLSRMFHKHSLKSAVGLVNLLRAGLNPAEANGIPVGEVVHCVERNVETRGVIDAENVDALALVGEFPAGSALGELAISCFLFFQINGRDCSRWESSIPRSQGRRRCRGISGGCPV